MWASPFVPMVGVLVPRRRMRRSYLHRFPPVYRKWIKDDVSDQDKDTLYGAYLELLDLRDHDMHESGWKQSADIILAALREKGWEIERDTDELIAVPPRRRPQLLLHEQSDEKHHIKHSSSEITVHEQGQDDVHIDEPAAEEHHLKQRTQNIHIHHANPRVNVHSAPQQRIIHHQVTHREVWTNAGPANPALKTIEPRKEKNKSKGKGKGRNKADNQRSDSEEEGDESDGSNRRSSKGKSKRNAKTKSKNRHRSSSPSSSSDQGSDHHSRGRQKNQKKNKKKNRPRSPSTSESESQSQSESESESESQSQASDNRSQPKQKLIKYTTDEKAKGRDDDYASGSDTEDSEVARSDGDDGKEQVKKYRAVEQRKGKKKTVNPERRKSGQRVKRR